MINLFNKLRSMSFILLGIFSSFMCVFTLFRHAWATPYPKITPQKPLLLIMLAILEFILLIGLFKIGLRLAARFEKRYIKIVLIIYFIIQVAFIFFPVNAYEDALIVEKLARDILQGDFFSLGIGHYLGYYPNNIGITLLFAFIYSFLPQSNITLRLCSAIFTTLSAWLIYKLYKELMPEEEKNSYGVLLLTIFFIPPIIINNFTYGDVFCNTFSLAAMLNTIRFVNRGRLRYALYTASKFYEKYSIIIHAPDIKGECPNAGQYYRMRHFIRVIIIIPLIQFLNIASFFLSMYITIGPTRYCYCGQKLFILKHRLFEAEK